MSQNDTMDTVEYAEWSDWNPADYINEYYADITLDGHYAVEWVVESMQKVDPVDVALEFGTGPVVIFSMPMVLKAKAVHMAEYLPANRSEVEKWLRKDPDAHDWLIFTKDMLQMEGNVNPTDEEAREREQLSRERIKGIWHGDVGQSDPLGPGKREFYPLVVSYCCADSSTDSKATWDIYMQNIASMVRPGGTLILAACEGHRYYCVGERCYPGAGVNAEDLLAWLRRNGFINIDVRSRQVPDNSEQGFSSIMFGRATKKETA
jgi:hypothetical protein